MLHLELSQPQHAAPPHDVLEPLSEICNEPTFVLDALLEALDDPLWTAQSVQVLLGWNERGLLSDRDVARCKAKVPVLEALVAAAPDGTRPGGPAHERSRPSARAIESVHGEG
ncbi:MAG: hypothetical protein R2710_05425 [Acidimicrobiales bacterium]